MCNTDDNRRDFGTSCICAVHAGAPTLSVCGMFAFPTLPSRSVWFVFDNAFHDLLNFVCGVMAKYCVDAVLYYGTQLCMYRCVPRRA